MFAWEVPVGGARTLPAAPSSAGLLHAAPPRRASRLLAFGPSEKRARGRREQAEEAVGKEQGGPPGPRVDNCAGANSLSPPSAPAVPQKGPMGD